MLRRIREFQATPGGAAFPLGRMLCAGLVAATAVYAIESLVVPQGRLDAFFDTWVYNSLLVASAPCAWPGPSGPRRAPLLVPARRALLLWTTGDLYYCSSSRTREVPTPSASDAFYLAFYPVSYVALALLLRSRIPASAADSGSTA